MPPRPRPRARQIPSSDNTTDPTKPRTIPERASSSALELEDEDALFIRNKNRGAKDWRALNKAVTRALSPLCLLLVLFTRGLRGRAAGAHTVKRG